MTTKKPIAKKKKKVVPKATRIRRLAKKCNDVVSLLVRVRDGSCVLCPDGVGQADYKKLNAHHWIISRARSVKHRFNPINLVSLCWAHHLHGVHKEASYAYLLKLKEAVLARGIATEEEIDRIARDDESVDLTEDWLTAQLQDLQRRASLYALQPIAAAGSCSESTASAPEA